MRLHIGFVRRDAKARPLWHGNVSILKQRLWKAVNHDLIPSQVAVLMFQRQEIGDTRGNVKVAGLCER